MQRGRSISTGFSLIELLVAVLVMGIGVLGVTALQMVSLQNNRDALERAEAVQLAYDIMDRIRANPGAAAGVAYAGVDIGDGPPSANDCIANVCSEAQMVAFDVASWKCTLGSYNGDGVCQGMRAGGILPPEDQLPGLPEGDGSIAIDGAGTVTITVQWAETNGQIQSIVAESQG